MKGQMPMKDFRFTWQRLGGAPPRGLAAARRELHHAAQLVSVAGRSFLPPREDDSHSSFRWIADADVMAGEPIAAGETFRIALRPADLSLHFLGEGDRITATLPLRGETLARAVDWIRSELARRGADAGRFSLDKPYELPAHPLLGGGAFMGDPPGAFRELAFAWGNAGGIQEEMAAEAAGSTEVRLWPHHFDVGFLILLDSSGSHSIGIGLSPGDDGVPEPYFYVTPNPAPAADALPPLHAPGRWHTEGWTGAILTATEVETASSAAAQERMARDFLNAAVAACRERLARP
jgi:hypothetical protein